MNVTYVRNVAATVHTENIRSSRLLQNEQLPKLRECDLRTIFQFASNLNVWCSCLHIQDGNDGRRVTAFFFLAKKKIFKVFVQLVDRNPIFGLTFDEVLAGTKRLRHAKRNGVYLFQNKRRTARKCTYSRRRHKSLIKVLLHDNPERPNRHSRERPMESRFLLWRFNKRTLLLLLNTNNL